MASVLRLKVAIAVSCLLAVVAAGPAFSGPSLVFDPASGDVFSQDRAGAPWYPASLTKLMTAFVVFQALHSGKLTLAQKIPVSDIASQQPPSKIGVPAGGSVTVDFALQAMLVYSANDMAVVLAEAAGGTVSAFVENMNSTARQIGMTGTRFVNPNGLHSPLQVTTARDLGILAASLLTEFPDYWHYFSQAFLAVGKRKLPNRNMLLRLASEVDGMKTGFVCASGYNLVATATENGRRRMAIVLGASNSQSRADWALGLLRNAFQSGSASQRIAQIDDVTLSLVEPTNMSSDVCGPRHSVPLVSASTPKGFGVLLGTYGAMADANALLKERIDQAKDYVEGASNGLVRVPNGGGFSALIWGLDQNKAAALCGFLNSAQAQCEIMTPDKFTDLAAKSQPHAKVAGHQRPSEKDDDKKEGD